MTRVYIPLNRAALESAIERGEVGPAPLTAYAVTPELQASVGMDLDDEELEYAAYRLAVDASRDMLAPDRSDDRRRLVMAADVTAIRPGAGDMASNTWPPCAPLLMGCFP